MVSASKETDFIIGHALIFLGQKWRIKNAFRFRKVDAVLLQIFAAFGFVVSDHTSNRIVNLPKKQGEVRKTNGDDRSFAAEEGCAGFWRFSARSRDCFSFGCCFIKPQLVAGLFGGKNEEKNAHSF
jgi:hypothetical protein